MKTRIRISYFLGPAAAAGFGVLVACTSSPRASIDDIDQEDAAPSASLPDAAPSADASSESDGAIPRPPFDPTDEPVTCPAAPARCAVQLVAGENHFCARMSDGSVRCWGMSDDGILGTSDDAADAGFVIGTVTDLHDARQLSAGGATTCALGANGDVRCWGKNDRGQLGLQSETALSDTDPHPIPAAVALPSGAARVDVGTTSACARLTSGEVWCWGDNSRRQLARASTETIGAPAAASLDGLTLSRTAASNFTAFGVSATGDLFVWGAVAGNEGCVAARAASIDRDPHPGAIGLGPVTSLTVSSTTIVYPTTTGHACAIVNGDVYCWGQSARGALGTGLPDGVPAPTRARIDAKGAWPQQVAAGAEITCVRLTDGSIQCAGDDTRGALGKKGTDTYSMFFEPAETFTGHAVSVATSSASVCALQKDGTVACWGSNEHGELGQGTNDTDRHSVPVPVGF